MKTIGYLVTSSGRPTGFSRDPNEDEVGVLWRGGSIKYTLFKTRKDAKKSIRKTKRFGKQYSWTWDYRVLPIARAS